jgi:hypothetical protein
MDTLDQVEVAIEEAEHKANSIDANPDVIRQYEARKIEIEKLEATVEQRVQDETDKAAQLDKKRDRWESKLQNQISEMNSLFSEYMKDMGNAGELVLYKGEPDDKGKYGRFKDWGVQIRVSFRGDTKAQVLSAQSHSGGERAVSTIMYLMGAQDRLVSPFRCVGTYTGCSVHCCSRRNPHSTSRHFLPTTDEINQGLDERNERLVFSRIVANSCTRPKLDPTDHSGQYFLITPKLLPNLKGMCNPGITVLAVFNGTQPFFLSRPRFHVRHNANVSLVTGAFNEIVELNCDQLLDFVGKRRAVDDEGENSGNSSEPRISKKSRRSDD